MKLFKKLAATVACFLAAASLAACGVVEKGAGYAGYHKVAEPEVLVNGEKIENSENYVEVKFYDGKDNDPINAGRTYVRAGKDVVITIGLAEGIELDGEVTCDIKTVSLIVKEEEKEDEPTSEPTTSEDSEGVDVAPKEAVKPTSEAAEKEALPVVVTYVFEMPDASPTFTIKVKGDVVVEPTEDPKDPSENSDTTSEDVKSDDSSVSTDEPTDSANSSEDVPAGE